MKSYKDWAFMMSLEESFRIEIVASDLDDLNDKKETSEKVNNENLLVKDNCSVTTKMTTTNGWVWIVGDAATSMSRSG